MSELAYYVNGSLSRLSNVVKRLEERGLVRREPSPENGRHINAILTDEGWQVVVAAAPGHVAAVRHFIFDALAQGQSEQMHDICDRVVKRADPQSTIARVDVWAVPGSGLPLAVKIYGKDEPLPVVSTSMANTVSCARWGHHQ